MSILLVSISILAVHLVNGAEVATEAEKNLAEPVQSETVKVECKPRDCPKVDGDDKMACGFSPNTTVYRMFPSQCALGAFSDCNEKLVETELRFCVKALLQKQTSLRRIFTQSCPAFCPQFWKPVCGARKYKAYSYRTFNNGCYLDMINCRGEDDDMGFIEVPLEFCQDHMMKNMFKEQIIVSGLRDYHDYV